MWHASSAVHGSVGDRAVILAPQGLDYILAFLGSMQAGLIAVPLPLPHRGSSHDRVSAVFADTKPSVVLTTSAVAEDVGDYVDQSRMDTAPKIIEIDSLNLDAEGGPSFSTADFPSTAYLQYSSGSTRLPTGVMISHRNLQVNFEQLMRSFFAGANVRSHPMPRSCRGCPSTTTWVWCWASAHPSWAAIPPS